VIFPFSTDFADIAESHKYRFGSLKLIEKQSLCDSPLLDDQINFLWREMKAKRETKAKSSINAYQRIIFVFEFMTGGRSGLESFGRSENYLHMPSFYSIKV
jgi:hypothetical protein